MDPDHEPDRERTSPRPVFDKEPLGEQVARRLRVTVALTVMPVLIGSIMLSIFTGFGRPEVGTVVICVLLLPVVIGAWVEYWIFRFRIRSYLDNPLADEKNDAPMV